ncbi:MAG: hypothetical protein EOQ63_15295 [Mesorhizobium sp.]|uniref:hypothetical protein n=2 Tax=Mesorhizobium TaxID=68287 RepID=UPI000FE775B6|nr:hypothetical protein [Mesorhizobium sp.]RWG47942.1 MAG: hypothetical protein EOQ63_15295 [Mesorhizobium sp.]TIR02327.1 MAG: hypothetical protein E5X32_27860 [Mesorhizobium sp.]
MIALKPSVLGARSDMTKDQISVPVQPADLKREIAHEIYQALEKLDASPELLGVIGSWSDGEGDDVVLKNLRAWNRDGSIFTKVICRSDRPA